MNDGVSTSRENGSGTPKSHISVFDGEAVTMATQLFGFAG